MKLFTIFSLILLAGCSNPNGPSYSPIPGTAPVPALRSAPPMPPGEMAFVTAQNSGKPQGVVSLPVSPAQAGTTTGAGTYPFKTQITIQAFPAADFTFGTWSDGNTSNPRSLSVPKGPTVLTAVFNQVIPPAIVTNWVNLAWTSAVAPDIVGYNVYWGPTSGNYTNHVHAGNTTSVTISNLTGTVFFCAKSQASNGFESICSNEVSKQVSP